MAKLYLVRHGRDTGSGGADPDPGLNEIGHQQAAEMTARMAPLGPLPMIVSPCGAPERPPRHWRPLGAWRQK